jgi:hypothetical protein
MLWFCINNFMQELSNGQKLQLAYRRHIAPYSNWVQISVTLTLKTTAKIRVKRYSNYGNECYEFLDNLDEDKLHSRISYFSALLRHELFGNKAKHKNKQEWTQPLVIAVTEGRNTHKRTHLHLAIGNIPKEKLGDIEATINRLWQRCDFAHKEVCVKHVTSGIGWLGYITKEIGYTDNDAIDIVASNIPPFIQQSICTESRLLTA